jgi:type IV pilus assembly protein PilW
LQGFSLVELLVAMAIGLVLVLAAAAALMVSSRGYTLVDAASQLRHNTTFAVGLVSRVAMQAGFVDIPFASTPATAWELAIVEPAVFGFNNATVTQTVGAALGTIRSTNTPVDTLYVKPWVAGSAGAGSDVLVLRYQPAGAGTERLRSDGSMVDCSGSAPDTASQSRNDTAINVFFVAADVGGEPALFCYTLDNLPNSQRMQFENRMALVRGVEGFQVLYGVQARAPVVANAALTSSEDGVPYAYLRADQLVVGGDASSPATKKNWRLVRSLRIGFVLRSEAQRQPTPGPRLLYPLGLARASAQGAPGSAFASAADPGTVFAVPNDGRLRATESFTVHLRNGQPD